MTIALCSTELLVGRTIEKVAEYWHGAGKSNAFLFTDGSVFGFQRNGDPAFLYQGRDQYDANSDQVMKVLGGMAVDLGLVSQAEYDCYKAFIDERARRETEESDRRLYEELKKKFEPKKG